MTTGTDRNRMNDRGLRTMRRNGFTLVELLVVIAIIGVLVALLLPAIQAAREAARRAQCQSNIKNVALAILNYESARKKLPLGMTFDASKYHGVIHNQLKEYGPNWVIYTLPYLEQQSTYDSFNLKLPINNEAAGVSTSDLRNKLARGTKIGVLLCPSDTNNATPYNGKLPLHGEGWARGNYAANSGGGYIGAGGSITGEPGGTMSNGPKADGTFLDNDAWLNDWRRGVMGPNVSVRLAEITDGTTKTILVGEVLSGLSDKDSRGTWAMGHAGASLLAMFGSGGDDNGPNMCGPSGDDVYSDMCDSAESTQQCMTCFNPGGGADQATTRSAHPGGVTIAMCDASVQFLSDNIETSGSRGPWGTPWDFMIASGDGRISSGN